MGQDCLCYSDVDLGLHGAECRRFVPWKEEVQKPVMDLTPARLLETMSRREVKHCLEL